MRSLLPSLSLTLVALCTACSLNPQPEPPAEFSPDAGKPGEIADSGTQANNNDAQDLADAAAYAPDCASTDSTSDSSEAKTDCATDASSDAPTDASSDALVDAPLDTADPEDSHSDSDSNSDSLSDSSILLDSQTPDSSQ